MSLQKKAFGLWSAVFLGIGSMVGVGIFIVIGEAGAIAGNLVIPAFVLGGLIALLAGYSLSKLALAYPSRGGVIEYLVQEYGEGYFSGVLGVLFYFSQLIDLSTLIKSFGVYAAACTKWGETAWVVNGFALGVLALFVLINLLGASFVAKSENLVVILKLVALSLFVGAALLFVDPRYLLAREHPSLLHLFYALGLVFFAYQGFSVITNSVEDMEDPKMNLPRSMMISIGLVMVLYTLTAVAVLGNLPINEVMEAKDYALAEAAKPLFGETGFKVMAAVALVSAMSAINATLYAATQISYDLAKKGELPKVYTYNVFHSTEGLLVSALLIVPMVLSMELEEIATVASVVLLFIHAFVHTGHLLKTKQTNASRFLVALAALGCYTATFFALLYIYHKLPVAGWYIVGFFFGAYLLEVGLRYFTGRKIKRQSSTSS